MDLNQEGNSEEYLSDEFVEDSLDSDGISHEEAWFIYGWKEAGEEKDTQDI